MRYRTTTLLFLLTTGCGLTPRMPVYEDPQHFESFMKSHQLAPAAQSAEMVQRGQDVFLNGPCVTCHTIQGTLAFGRVGPDLSHLATRRTLAAGTLPNTRGNLAGWILNPQNLKPETKMPPSLLSSTDLQALLAYLETLR